MPATLKAGLLGGIVLFAWGMISWMIMPYHSAVLHQFPNEAVISETLASYAPKAGVYVVPHNKDSLKPGHPFAFISVRPGGLPLSMGQMFAVALAGNIAVAFLVAYVVSLVKSRAYSRRFGLVLVQGIMVIIAANLPLWNWWGFAGDYIVATSIDAAIGWALMGSVIARFAGDPY